MRFQWPLGPSSFSLCTEESDLIADFSQMLGSEAGNGNTVIGEIHIAGGQNESITVGPQIRADDGRSFVFDNDVTYRLQHGSRVAYDVFVKDVARGMVSCHRNMAHWQLARRPPARTAFHLLALDPLSLFAPRLGLMVCHGGAVVSDDRALLLFGVSGVGKSTLGFLLSHTGDCDFRSLTDDTFVLDFGGNDVLVWPISTGFGLSLDFLNGAGIDVQSGNVLQRIERKTYVKRLPRQAEGRPYFVKDVVFLDRRRSAGGRPSILRLRQTQAVMALLDSQASIPTPYTAEKLGLWARLARQATATSVLFDDYCDPKLLRSVIQG